MPFSRLHRFFSLLLIDISPFVILQSLFLVLMMTCTLRSLLFGALTLTTFLYQSLADDRTLNDRNTEALHALPAGSGSNETLSEVLHLRHLSHRDTGSDNSTSSSSDDYSCSAANPCSNGACCGKSGYCGYGPTYCGTGCQSNCTAKAECGQYASPANATCPLNVCCSQYGFCGTTDDFCGELLLVQRN